MQQQLTLENVQQERLRLALAIETLKRKQVAAEGLAQALSADPPTIPQILHAFSAYHTAESIALSHDVATLTEQVAQLDQLEKHVRFQASGLVVAAPAAGRR